MAYLVAIRFYVSLQELTQNKKEKVFIEYARQTFGKNIPENEVLAIDGKTIKRSEYAPEGEDKKPHKVAHVVSAKVAFTMLKWLSGGENDITRII